MCGFAAFFQPKRMFSNILLSAIDKDLYHRGPDSGGNLSEKGIALVFRRLSILDPKEISDQPMTSDDGNYTIVYNGEIYNFKSIKNKLINLGVNFKTSGDTEVILNGYRSFGIKILDYLQGMYSFVIIDRKKGIALAARDPFGIKPLYMLRAGNFTGFSSEMRVFSRIRKAQPDPQALSELLTFKWAAGELSNELGIVRMEGGSFYKINLNDGEIKKYKFCETLDCLSKNEETSIEEAQEAMIKSIEDHLLSDVGYSLQLSGGVDSSLITAIASKKSKSKLLAYGISLNEKKYDEFKYRKMVKKKYPIELIDLKITNKSYADALPETINSIEGPSSHGGCVALWLLCKEISKKNKVVLTGEGADEFFGGYERYAIWKKLMWQERLSKLPFIQFFPNKYPFKGIKNFLGRDAAIYSSIYHDLNPLNKIFPEFFPTPFSYRNKISKKFNNFRDRLYSVDQKSYLESLLIRQDKISMASSLEARVPFVHLPLWKILARLPHHIKTPGKITKPVLKFIASKHLPNSLVYRRKNGLLLPYDKWLSDDAGLGRYLEMLTENNAPIKEYADNKKLTDIINLFRKERNYNISGLLNKIINIDLWLRNFSNRPKLIKEFEI